MEWFNLPLAVLALLLLLLLILRLRRRQSLQHRAYLRRDRLLSNDERNFLAALEQAVGERHRVLCKVRMAAVTELAERLDHRQWQHAFAAIRDRHFDFLVCDGESLEPVCAVELAVRGRRDPLLDRVCGQAQLPLLCFISQGHYVAAEIGLQFDSLFAADESIPQLGFEALAASDDATQTGLLGPARPAEPNCPECGAPMALRKTVGDFQVEQGFWLCGLPECRKRVPFEPEA
ncbi:hypothetical protein GCM10011348_39020 [Marinobacterium nitratireducens]|uniref:DUF2726 domain-containing protein n=1 Tax=Marinobacterium nitratireducens TaxID=518897 RepID=A0A917ZP96_9GAMM|nr:DUF2726 domain-containing protein [Marinobacterium nitratireducens]GGO86946.1 hypothetical protein GCM10011348_39020 [Marinobacterium nitratireducens]